MKILGICGMPGSGKTTIMREVMRLLMLSNEHTAHKFGTLLYHQFVDVDNVSVLGQYNGAYFDGTDKLSMAVIRDTEKYLLLHENEDTIILFEGDRLWCPRFVNFMLNHAEKVMCFRLFISPKVFENRYTNRCKQGIVQSTAFLKGRNTKYSNLEHEYPGLFVRCNNDTITEQAKIIKQILGFIKEVAV